MKIDVVINRNARRLAADGPLLRTLTSAARRGGATVHETRSTDELDQVADVIAQRGTDGVVLAGGDGSHSAGVSALSRAFGGALPPVALAPGGTVCTVARNFGMRGAARAWSEGVVATLCAGEARVEARPTLCVRDDSGIDRVGFIFGAGLVATFFDVYCGLPRQGLWAAAQIASRVFVGSLVGSSFAERVLGPTVCTLSIDGARQASETWGLVLASVVRDVGLHLLAAYRAGFALDRFHAVASGLPPRALGQQMPRVLLGLPIRGDPRVDTLARSLRLRFETPGASYVLDGDVIHTREVHVGVGPQVPLVVLS